MVTEEETMINIENNWRTVVIIGMILMNQVMVNMIISMKTNMIVSMEVEMILNTKDTKVNMINIIKSLVDTKRVDINLETIDTMEEVASMDKDRMIIMVVVSTVVDKINMKEIIEMKETTDNLLKNNIDITNKKGMSRVDIKLEILPETIEIIIEMISMRRDKTTMIITREERIEMEQERVLEKEESLIKIIRTRKRISPTTSFNLSYMNDYKFINSYY